MRTILQSVLLSALVSAERKHPVRQEIVDQIKAKTNAWHPREVSENHLSRVPLDKIPGRMGSMGTDFFTDGVSNLTKTVVQSATGLVHDMFQVFASSSHPNLMASDTKEERTKSGKTDIPEAFSWQDHSSYCLGDIEDQLDCGSCWAFSSAGFLADRFCIHSNGAITTRFSPQELVNCNYENFACLGGYLMPSIDYLQTEGVVSRDCLQYKNEIGYCTYRCDDGSVENYEKHYCKLGSMSITTLRHDIMTEIYKNGPVMMGLVIYEDFMSYAGGIYHYTAGEEIGGHAMKAVGYGQDDTYGHYWILQNQWTTEWGEKGFIKIKAGEIGIDSVALACLPDLI